MTQAVRDESPNKEIPVALAAGRGSNRDRRCCFSGFPRLLASQNELACPCSRTVLSSLLSDVALNAYLTSRNSSLTGLSSYDLTELIEWDRAHRNPHPAPP